MTAPSPESLALPEPDIPPHPEPHVMQWSELEKTAIRSAIKAERLRVIDECKSIAKKYLIPGHISTGNFLQIINEINALKKKPNV